MRIFRAQDYKRMPWKNGGGETTEIAVYPDNADLASFDWRVSMANVATDGPFSAFPDIDRTLSILEGAGLDLTISGAPAMLLTKSSDPLSFPADVTTSAKLNDGPILDLNVMTRRSVLSHRVERHALSGTRRQPTVTDCLVFCAEGSVDIRAGGKADRLKARDAALVQGGVELTLSATKAADVFLITFRDLRA
jgi:hypothetical protein